MNFYSSLITGLMEIGVCARFPVRGIDLILSNDPKEEKGFAAPEVVQNHVLVTGSTCH